MKTRVAPAAFLSALLAPAPWAQEGKLGEVRSAVREDHGDKDHDDHEHDDDDWLDVDESDSSDGWLGDVFLFPFTLPRLVLGDSGTDRVYFRDHPGAGGEGYWLVDPAPDVQLENWSTEVRFEAGTDGDDLERIGGALRLEHAIRLGLDFSWNRWTEDLAAGGEDELWLGDANVVYRFANSARSVYRVGAGLNWLADDADQDYGFNFTYGAQWFLGSALEVSAELDLGDLGAADFAHVRVGLGYLLGRTALTLAYDDHDIQGVDLTSVSLGLAAWF